MCTMSGRCCWIGKEKKWENGEKEKVLNTIITTENEWVCLQGMTSCCEFSCHHKWLGKLQAYIYVSQKKPDFIRTVIEPQTKKKTTRKHRGLQIIALWNKLGCAHRGYTTVPIQRVMVGLGVPQKRCP